LRSPKQYKCNIFSGKQSSSILESILKQAKTGR
jgi:hypothetical protein